MATTFNYRIITKEGKERKGSIDSDSLEKAKSTIKGEGSTIISISEANAFNKDLSISFGTKKLKPRELSVFCRQFLSIISAGISIVNALSMLAEQTDNKVLKEALFNVKSNVEKGDTLAGALKKEGKLFPPLLINMIEAGEASGSLEKSLTRMSEHFEKDAKIKALVKKAMIYPAALLMVMLGVIVIMLVYVIPNFEEMFDSIDSELPLYTQMVVNLSDFLIDNAIVLIITIIALVFVYRWYKSTENGARLFSIIQLKIPVIGKLVTKSASARFARTLSTLTSAGMPMVEAMEITAKTMDNVLFRDALLEAKMQIQRGIPLSSPIRSCGLFPSMVIHMIGIGEETGNLEEMLDNVARYFEEEVEVATQEVTALMEPLIIVVMAVVVGALIMAIYSPMMKLYSDIG